ncbi:unnamed protein product [Rotaria magnacalcarata]|uniref:G-protein coupled receptors family 1 profile domain-containing protein n=2 Tax=Rotaria magnacalcarata TaxID=392030 RepID=A0A816ZK87_9BILA|nr:unnamed protein product [Rotaria magnacalcarata]CAF2210632.1 unnamed protein product [Rotaria magnacalcarata]
MNYIQNVLMQISIPYIIIVSLVGIAGNVITIFMLSKRSLTKNFNNCTLIALAITDLLFNLALVSRCLSDLMELNSDSFCRLLSFLSHLAELLSPCFTVHFTVQRFIAVRFPLSAFIERKNHFLHYLIVILFILFGISYCLALTKMNLYEHCQEELYLDWFLSDALSSFVIPFTVIAVLNLLIIFHLKKTCRDNPQVSFSKRSKRDFLSLDTSRKSIASYDSASQSKLSETTTAPIIKNTKYRFSTSEEMKDHHLNVAYAPRHTPSIRSTTRSHAQSHRVTRMLILVSTCFLLLNAPSHICTITLKVYTLKKSQLFNNTVQNYIRQMNASNGTASVLVENPNLILKMAMRAGENKSVINVNFFLIFYIVVIISQHISYLSYSINFFLYSFCGMKFRQELVKYLSR